MSWPLRLVLAVVAVGGCKSTPTGDDDTDPSTVVDTGVPSPLPVSCGAPLCISTDLDRFEEDRLIATTNVPACFYGSGFAAFPPPRIFIDGVQILEGGGNGSTCVGAGEIPPETFSGELWVEQGTDADGDGVEDAGSAVESNHLDIVTPPWVSGIAPTEAASGDEVVVSVENVTTDVSFEVVSRGGCGIDTLWTTPDEVRVTPLWDSLANDCQIWVQSGFIETGAGAQVAPNDAPWLDILPVVELGCAARVGEPCTLVGTGLGTPDGLVSVTPWTAGQPATLELDGVLYVPGPNDDWANTEITFEMPDIAPGVYPFTITTAAGRTFTGEFTNLQWERHELDVVPYFDYDHENTMFTATTGFITQPFNALEVREVVYAVGEDSGGTVRVQGIPHPDFPNPTTHQLNRSSWGVCTRMRATGVKDAVDLGNNDPHFIVAARRQGADAVVDWDGVPARDCEPSSNIEVIGEDAPGYYPAFSVEFSPASPQVVTAGLARFDFGFDPPTPDPLGRPAIRTPILAVRDDAAGTTDIQLAFGAPLSSLYGAPLTGRGTLHEAGEYVYLAGGEPGFDGILHELQWDSERTIETPILGLTPEQMPVFTGAPDGTLWAFVIDAAGLGKVFTWDPVQSSWTEHSTVPEAVMDTDTATLLADPTAHGVRDMAVYQGEPVLVVHRVVGTGIRAIVTAWDGDSWEDVGEPLNGLQELDVACLSHDSDDLPPSLECPSGTARYPLNGQYPVDDVPQGTRILATPDGVYVRYLIDDGTVFGSRVASTHGPLFAE